MSYRLCKPLGRPKDRGGTPPSYRRSIVDGMLIERDVAVALRDGAIIFIDLFRPAQGPPVPPLIAWGPYGKHGHTRYALQFPKADVDDRSISRFTAFEAPDPSDWVPHGYAIINVDPRGTWFSKGVASYLSPEEAQDYHDLIEWAGTQSWSNGKVGLSGVSYLTSSQWRVAETRPPHLAAINPWEGWSDTYREVVRHGGIPETSFWPYLPGRWGHGTQMIEDLRAETDARPFYDDYWASKAADLSKITVPAFVVASWTDQGLHTRGTLEGFRHIESKHKWLYVHGQKKWAHYYDRRSIAMQRAFFDHVLKGHDNEVLAWPKVRFEIRERLGRSVAAIAKNWPPRRTRYVKLFLDGASGKLVPTPPAMPASTRYRATGEQVGFDFVFSETTDLVGHMKLRLWVAAEGSDDMDLFIAVQKLNREGKVVPFAYYAQFEDGPVALGWLRVSHRELDMTRSTAFQPVLRHQRAIKLKPFEIVPVEIEIWPSGTRFAAKEGLRLVIQGSDIYDYPEPSVYARHQQTVNRGFHVIHAGGAYDSHLLVPVFQQAEGEAEPAA